jgi:GNAT superfamily N-acetyltransferase
VLAAAYAELFAAREAGADAPGRLESVAGTLCSRTAGIDEPGWSLYLNLASGLGLGQPATEQVVDDVLAFYGPGHAPFVVAVDPEARPLALAGWLEARGLRRRLIMPRCQRVPDAPPDAEPGPFRIEDVGPGSGDAYAAVAGHGLPASVARGVAALAGRPGWRHFLAWDGPTAIAAAALFVQEGVACFCWSATHPAHRRRGAHRALIIHRLRQAAELGCQLAVAETLEASSARPGASLRNLLRAGFQITEQARIYVG